MFDFSKKKRPSGVPNEAKWREDSKDWVLETRDEMGRRQGAFLVWREDGSLQVSFNFKDEVLHGDWKRYHPNGEIAAEKTFYNGIAVIETLFHRSSEETDENYFPPFADEEAWTIALKYDDFGRDKGFATFNKEGEILEERDFQEGPPKKKVVYVCAPKTEHPPQGVPTEARWLEEFKEWELGKYDDGGKKQGEFKWWRTDGTLACVSFFKDDKLNGKFKRYHPNGEVSQEGEYEMEKVIGRQIWYKSEDPTPEGQGFEQLPEGIWTVIMDHDPSSENPFEYLDKEGKPYTEEDEEE